MLSCVPSSIGSARQADNYEIPESGAEPGGRLHGRAADRERGGEDDEHCDECEGERVGEPLFEPFGQPQAGTREPGPCKFVANVHADGRISNVARHLRQDAFEQRRHQAELTRADHEVPRGFELLPADGVEEVLGLMLE